MKRTVLNRYERTQDNRIIIDVATTRVETLYNDFDKNAPYIRRDLDPDLVDYLITCMREIKHESFILRFTLAQSPDNAKQSRIRRSVNSYFLYLAESQRHQVLQMFHQALILFCIGLAVLFLSVSINQKLLDNGSVIATMFAEGLTVAAWVALWESLAIFLIKWFPLRKNIRIYQTLAEAEVNFRADGDVASKPDKIR